MTTAADIEIVPFQPRHAAHWRALNEAWLAAGNFPVEAADRRVIDDPEGNILRAGGHIFIAEQNGQAIGCCALIPMADGGREVAKMTVTPATRGLGLGRRLLQTCETAARAAGAHRLYLETSDTLGPALALYRSFGFTALPPAPTPYVRCNTWMEKRL